MKNANACKIRINADAAIKILKGKHNEIDTYIMIMDQVGSIDVSKNKCFQRVFNGFYKIRRSEDRRRIYYSIFEKCKSKENVDFSFILRELKEITGWYEPSFSSKMLASLNPGMPIWDKNVLSCLGLKPHYYTDKEKRLCDCEDIYEEICESYRNFIKTDECRAVVERFNEAFPDAAGISKVKKIDFLLWASPEEE